MREGRIDRATEGLPRSLVANGSRCSRTPGEAQNVLKVDNHRKGPSSESRGPDSG